MSRLKVLFVAAAIAAAATGTSSAEVALEGVHWQVGHVEGGRVAYWQDVKSLPAAPKPADRMRARLVLKNAGPQAEEGLLLRYSLTARVVSGDGPAAGAAWAVPFVIDERRVPKVAADKVIDVPIDAGAPVDLYLRRVARAGWRPDRLKIQVMLEPHRGCKTLQIVEDVLDVGDGTAKP